MVDTPRVMESHAEIRLAEEGKYKRGAISEESGQMPAGLPLDSPIPSLKRVETASSKKPVTKERRPKKTRSSSYAATDGAEAPPLDEEADPEITRQANPAQKIQGQRGTSWKWNNLFSCFSTNSPEEEERGKVGLDIEKPGPWLVEHHASGLLKEIRKTNEDHNESIYRVNLAEMQRMHLRKLQIKLVQRAVTMCSTVDESSNWEKDLAAYIQAMRDYNYMTLRNKEPRDYFLVTGEREIDRHITKSVIYQIVGDPDKLPSLKSTSPVGPWETDPRPIGDTRDRIITAMSFQELRARVFLGTVGGVLLLGPMWLMVLHKTLYTGLITTTACVVVFGLVAVFWLETPMDVLSATAAYSAVLVVFVGLNT